jgi:hypothetical protein
MPRTLSLIVRNVMFTIVVPGLGGVLAPWWILNSHGGATVAAWEAVPVIVAGAALGLAPDNHTAGQITPSPGFLVCTGLTRAVCWP